MEKSCGASMAEMIKGFVVAGPASGVGKTPVTLALMAASRKRGMQVQPFKCGPDFIDAGHHTRACGRASRNLDGWMLSSDKNRDIFCRSAVGADVCIVEGVMGLFDGASGKSDVGSTAEMAKLLGLPVVLVVDASSVARSVAALVHGFGTFDPEVKLLSVIFNKVGGPTHYALLRDAVESACGAAPLGYLRGTTEFKYQNGTLGCLQPAKTSFQTQVEPCSPESRKTISTWKSYLDPQPLSMRNPLPGNQRRQVPVCA
jgi:cobyrinic acid a,c-diamide synthase